MPTKLNYISAWIISYFVAGISFWIISLVSFFALTFIGPFLSWFPGYRGSGGFELAIALAIVAGGFAFYKTIVAMYRHRYPKLNYKKVVPSVMVLGLFSSLSALVRGLRVENDFLVLYALVNALVFLFFVGQLTEMEKAKSD